MDDDIRTLRRIIGYRMPLWHPDFPFTLAWSQKAGCTFAVKWFFWQIGLLDEALARHPWVHIYENEVFYRRDGYGAAALESIASRRKPHIKLLRNPYQRAVSAYLIFAYPPSSEPHWSIESFEQLQALTETDRPAESALSFRDMLRAVAGNSIYALNPHITPQLQPDEGDYIDRVIFLDEAEAGFRNLESEFGLDPAPIDELRQSGHDKVQAHDWSDEDLLADTRKPFGWLRDAPAPPYARFLDEETCALIRAAYARDFELAERFGREYRTDRAGPDAIERTG